LNAAVIVFIGFRQHSIDQLLTEAKALVCQDRSKLLSTQRSLSTFVRFVEEFCKVAKDCKQLMRSTVTDKS
jgi:hypothetical protein